MRDSPGERSLDTIRDRDVDAFAIHRRYSLRWSDTTLYVVAMVMMVAPHVEPFSGEALRDRRDRLVDTALTSPDAEIRLAAQTRQLAIEAGWRWRHRGLIRWAPLVLGLALMSLGLRPR